jgi:hypothetical protein
MLTERTVAMGLTMPWPEMSGAEPVMLLVPLSFLDFEESKLP